MSKDLKLQDLAKLSTIKLQVVQVEMAKLKEREAALRLSIKNLSESKHHQISTASASDPALIAGANIRWHQWVDQRKTSVNYELAQVLAQRERYLAQLKLAFGQNEAIKKLFKSEERKARLQYLQRNH